MSLSKGDRFDRSSNHSRRASGFIAGCIASALIAAPASAQGTPSLAHAKQQFDARNYDAARVEYTALAKATPNDVVPALYLGKIGLAQNDHEEGIKQFERCVAIDERSAECHLWLGNALGMAAQHASKFKLPFLARRTKKEFDRAVELDPDNVDARFGVLQYFMYAPGFLGGSADKAREQAAEIDKRSKLRGALAYGALADHDKNVKEAEAAYQRAIAAAPDSAAGYTQLANLYVRDKRWTDAFAMLDKARPRVPADANIDLNIARVAYVSGEQLAKGEDAAKRWLASPPKDATPGMQAVGHLRLGHIYEKTNRRELARAEYEKAVSLNPKNEDAKKALDGVK
jgi:tetratricopeptide (TPR) repeat protein